MEVSINVPQSGWFIMENPIEMHDLGVQPFMEAYIFLSEILMGDMGTCRYIES